MYGSGFGFRKILETYIVSGFGFRKVLGTYNGVYVLALLKNKI